ncbi:MAG: hypothetical protein F6K55_03360 [Moorea sp. SIO4A3]|nr:hypothetical protein [Moorena sp. SIO4A3]
MNSLTSEYVENILNNSDVEYFEAFGKALIAVYRLPNGHVLTGMGACVDPTIYDIDAGKKVAREQVADQIWAREGYLLQQRLHEEANG